MPSLPIHQRAPRAQLACHLSPALPTDVARTDGFEVVVRNTFIHIDQQACTRTPVGGARTCSARLLEPSSPATLRRLLADFAEGDRSRTHFGEDGGDDANAPATELYDQTPTMSPFVAKYTPTALYPNSSPWTCAQFDSVEPLPLPTLALYSVPISLGSMHAAFLPQMVSLGAGGEDDGSEATSQGDSPPATPAPPSIGSLQHFAVAADGQPACRPCAWFHKRHGCQNAENCQFCHLCPEGELKRRKKDKVARMCQSAAQGGQRLSSLAARR